MTDARFAAAVAEARQAPIRSATLFFFVLMGVHAVFDGVGLGTSGGFWKRVIGSAAASALFVLLLRRQRR